MAMTLAKLRSGLQTAIRNADRSKIITRSMSSSSGLDPDYEVREAYKWRKITYAGMVVCFAYGFYVLSKDHPHHEEPPAYSYLRIRNKDFPWGPDPLVDHYFKKKKHD